MTSFVHHLGVHRQKASHASSWPAKAVTFKRASHERKDFEGVFFFFFASRRSPYESIFHCRIFCWSGWSRALDLEPVQYARHEGDQPRAVCQGWGQGPGISSGPSNDISTSSIGKFECLTGKPGSCEILVSNGIQVVDGTSVFHHPNSKPCGYVVFIGHNSLVGRWWRSYC
jgi:hypothetical protein